MHSSEFHGGFFDFIAMSRYQFDCFSRFSHFFDAFAFLGGWSVSSCVEVAGSWDSLGFSRLYGRAGSYHIQADLRSTVMLWLRHWLFSCSDYANRSFIHIFEGFMVNLDSIKLRCLDIYRYVFSDTHHQEHALRCKQNTQSKEDEAWFDTSTVTW
jgi:hypothetical protein